MDKNEDYNFERLSGASNLEEVPHALESVSFQRAFARLTLIQFMRKEL